MQLAVLPGIVAVVHGLLSLQLVGQVAGGSQVSPDSMMPLPHAAEQLLSLALVQPLGQQPSPLVQVVMLVWLQATLQLAALPVIVSVVHGLLSLQLAGHVPGGSQVSPDSTTPLPQLGLQLLSLLALQPEGQQPSPPTHAVMVVCVQATLQVAALPVIVSVVHGLLSLQLAGQLPGGSQVSPGSMMPLPQTALQLLSLLALQPGGQQLSPLAHATMGVCVQAALQVAALPVITSAVQGLPSLQVVGQVAGGSQVSPGSTTPLPQVELQSLSLLCVHPLGQQLSLLMQPTTGVWLHTTLQLAGLPTIESGVQALPSLQVVGQLAGGSQVSGGSTTPLPQLP